MDDFLKEALEIVKAQASVRVMSDEQIIAMVRSLSSGLKTATVSYTHLRAHET